MTVISKAKAIKEKGIALCHESQGYSANMRPVSLLMKSELAPEQITEDVVKALRQVTVAMSFEEFLRKFFGVWWDDAELLAKILGFETEMENDAAENPDDEWLQAYNTSQQERLEEKMSAITIAKSAQAGEELDLIKQYDLLKLQQMFEKGVDAFGVTFPEGEAEQTQTTGVVENAGTEPVEIDKSKDNKETSVSDNVDVTKSQAYLDLMKQFEESKAKNEAADAIIKAAADLEKSNALVKAKSFTFAEEADHAVLSDMIVEKSAVVAILEKAQARIVELEAEIVKVKEEFATAEHGQDGATTTDDIVQSPEDIIAANVAKAKEKARQAANA